MASNFHALKFLSEYASDRFGRTLKPEPFVKPSDFFEQLRKLRNQRAHSGLSDTSSFRHKKFVQDDAYNELYSSLFQYLETDKIPRLRFLSYVLSGDSETNAQFSNRRLTSQTQKDFIYHLFEEYSNSTIQDLHTVFISSLAFTLFFEECYVFETDFSHARNIIPKYNFKVKNSRISKIDWPEQYEFSLFSKKGLRSGSFGFANKISDIIKFQNNLMSSDIISDHYSMPTENLYYWFGQNGGYTVLYIFPFKFQIMRDSLNVQLSEEIFQALFNCLNIKATNIIQNNQLKGRLRHTVAVQFRLIAESFDIVWNEKEKFDIHDPRSAQALNIAISKIYLGKKKMITQMDKQFKNDYDQFGARITLSHDEVVEEILSYEKLLDLIRSIIDTLNLTDERSLFRLKIDEDFSAFVKDTEALRAALTEIMFNAIKYNISNEKIRVSARSEGRSALIEIVNVGPALGDLEKEKIPSMGLRGINASRRSSHGSGQGLASMFELLEGIDIDAEYKVYELTPEQKERLAVWRRKEPYPLSNHLLRLTLEGN